MKIWMIDLIYVNYFAANLNIFDFMIFKILLRIILQIVLVKCQKLLLAMRFRILFVALVIAIRLFSVHLLGSLTSPRCTLALLSWRIQNLHFVFGDNDVNEVTHPSYWRLRLFLIFHVNFTVKILGCKLGMTIFWKNDVWIISKQRCCAPLNISF